MRRRVVVTGIGCVTPSGNNPEKLWENLLAGRSGVGKTTLFDASNFPTKISAQVKDWSIAEEGEDAATWAPRSRHTQFAAGAAKQAVRDSGATGPGGPMAIARSTIIARSNRSIRTRSSFSRAPK